MRFSTFPVPVFNTSRMRFSSAGPVTSGNSLGSGDTLGLARARDRVPRLGFFVVTLWPFARPAAMPVFGVLYLSNALARRRPCSIQRQTWREVAGGRSRFTGVPGDKVLNCTSSSRRAPRARGQNLMAASGGRDEAGLQIGETNALDTPFSEEPRRPPSARQWVQTHLMYLIYWDNGSFSRNMRVCAAAPSELLV